MRKQSSLKEWVDESNDMQPGIKSPNPVSGPEVIIVEDGKYADFNDPERPGHMGAQVLEAGAVVAYPRWYGDALVEAGRAMKLEDAIVEAIDQKGDANATDSAAKLAGEHGIDLDSVKGSGKDGRIIMSDIKELIQE